MAAAEFKSQGSKTGPGNQLPKNICPDVNIKTLANTTIGMIGADLANLCNEATLVAARHDRDIVSRADFEEAQDKIRLGAVRSRLIDPDEPRVVAYHESGHAVVAWLTPAADPVIKVTIVPHGQKLGLTEQVPGEERHNFSYSFLKARVAVMLGGRAAEELAIGEVTTGAENDLVEATRLARRMVTRWGMGKLGLTAFKTDEQLPFLGYEISQGREYSEHTTARIDEEVRQLLEDTHQEVLQRLTGVRDRLDRLVRALLREETVGAADLKRIVGPSLVDALGSTDRRGPVHHAQILVCQQSASSQHDHYFSPVQARHWPSQTPRWKITKDPLPLFSRQKRAPHKAHSHVG